MDSNLDILHKVYHEADENHSKKIETRGFFRGEVYVYSTVSYIHMKKGLSDMHVRNEDAEILLLSKRAMIDAIPALDIASRK